MAEKHEKSNVSTTDCTAKVANRAVKQYKVSISRVDLKYSNYQAAKRLKVQEAAADYGDFYNPAVMLLDKIYSDTNIN